MKPNTFDTDITLWATNEGYWMLSIAKDGREINVHIGSFHASYLIEKKNLPFASQKHESAVSLKEAQTKAQLYLRSEQSMWYLDVTLPKQTEYSIPLLDSSYRMDKMMDLGIKQKPVINNHEQNQSERST